MNLILSDVEETIMIVDQVEGAPDGTGTVNVRLRFVSARLCRITDALVLRLQSGRWTCFLFAETALFS